MGPIVSRLPCLLLSWWRRTFRDMTTSVYYSVKIVLNFMISFMYIMKSCGPSIDPCGTPLVISVESDLLLPNWAYCLRLLS